MPDLSATQPLRLAYREFVGFERALARQAAAYAERHPGFALAPRAFDVPALHREMVEEEGAGSGRYDLFLAVTDWLPELMRRGLLLPLSRYLDADPPDDWPDGWSTSMRGLQTDRDGRVYGLPYHDGPEVLMYRTDLFGDPTEQARFERQHGRPLVPPRTWSDFLDVARFFTRPSDDLYGCVVAAQADGHNDVYDFMLHLWSRGGELLDARLRPAFASPLGEAALRYYLDLIHMHRVTQPEPWAYESVRSGDFYASGRAAMMWNWCGFQAVADTPALSRIPGRTRATMVPAGDGPGGRAVSLNIYWVLGVPIGCPRPDEAYRFMRHLATPAMDKITSLEGGNGTRLSTWRDPDVRRRFQYYEVIEEVHRHVMSPPRLPEYPAINDILDRMMAGLIAGRQEIAPALRQASEQVESLLAEAGYYRDP